ncbi:unnamed protein product, partial [Rotaria sp. Silwood1]
IRTRQVNLALFIPVFFDTHLITLTRDNIAFFILFDFFAESYHRFRGIAIKATLYIFVVIVTVSVATEWIYIAKHEFKFEIASIISEIIAACFCYAFIVMQARTLSTGTSIATARLSVVRTNNSISNGINSDNRISYF